MRIQRSCDSFRPLYLDGTQVGAIHLYDAAGVWYTSNRGWLEHSEEGGSRDVVAINVEEVRSARKVDCSRGDVFAIPLPPDEYQRGPGGKRVAVYIPADRVQPTERIHLDQDTHTTYIDEYRGVKVDCLIQKWEPATEGEEEDRYSRGKYVKVPAPPLTLTADRVTRTHTKPFGQEVANLVEQMNAVLPRVQLSSYQVELLLQHFTIKPK